MRGVGGGGGGGGYGFECNSVYMQVPQPTVLIQQAYPPSVSQWYWTSHYLQKENITYNVQVT